ncbi:hypothetical protein F4780DRAFT_759089 [Xylariomycetidae sp. FL0641]|nr:hypothetical protein F4780DRAFT_759089 [Xylariomycetidae sp. FL0641]
MVLHRRCISNVPFFSSVISDPSRTSEEEVSMYSRRLGALREPLVNAPVRLPTACICMGHPDYLPTYFSADGGDARPDDEEDDRRRPACEEHVELQIWFIRRCNKHAGQGRQAGRQATQGQLHPASILLSLFLLLSISPLRVLLHCTAWRSVSHARGRVPAISPRALTTTSMQVDRRQRVSECVVRRAAGVVAICAKPAG